jgi:hypothetical protein
VGGTGYLRPPTAEPYSELGDRWECGAVARDSSAGGLMATDRFSPHRVLVPKDFPTLGRTSVPAHRTHVQGPGGDDDL